MPTIKGPIKMKGGFNARKFLEENAKDVKIKLPFTAKGWKSTKNSDLVDGEKIAKKVVKKEAKKKVVKKKKGFLGF